MILMNAPWDILNDIDDIDLALDTWVSLFMNVVEHHLPVRTKRVRKKACPWITKEVVQLMNERDRLHRVAVNKNDSRAWSEYKVLRNRVTHMLKMCKANYYHRIIRENGHNHKKMWSCLKEIIPNSGRVLPGNIKSGNDECTSPRVIANAFNQYFISSVEEITSNVPTYEPNVADREHMADTRATFCLQPVSANFVINEISKMDSNKATGNDNISCRLLKLACPVVAKSLTSIINLSLKKGCVPRLWKSAKVLPLHKSGDTSCLKNYRPISVLPVLSKILERAVYNQLFQFISDHNLLHSNQSGFRPMHSTTTALMKLVNLWASSINEGKLTGVAFIDLRKAFDTVNHELLLTKLRELGCSESSLNWFQSYLADRTQNVNYKGAISQAKAVKTGVPQGSILGPLLFSVYVNSLPNSVSIGSIDMYADDTTLTVSGTDASEIEEKLTNGVNQVMNWISANRLVINLDKTTVMVIGSRGKLNRIDSLNIIAKGNHLKRVRVAKCLGVLIDEELHWTDQVEKVTKTVQSKLSMLRRVKPFVPTECLAMLYNSFVQPHFDYCCQVWSNRFRMHTIKLEKLQKQAARIILSKNYYTPSVELFRELKWMPLNKRFRYHRAMLMFKCLNNLAPAYLCDNFIQINQMHNHNTRHALNSLATPKIRTECFRNSPIVTGINVWNSLDQSLRNASSFTSFKFSLRESFM